MIIVMILNYDEAYKSMNVKALGKIKRAVTIDF